MKFIIDDQLTSSKVEPDELSYLFDILNPIMDYFKHDDINFIVTRNTTNKFPEGNNIIFLTGNESECKLRDNNFKLCFSNFFQNSSDSRFLPLPLGVNKFLNSYKMQYVENIPINDRIYDIFFAGFIHPTRREFKNIVDNLSSKKYLFFTDRNNLQTFENALSPVDYVDILRNSKIVLAPKGAHHITSYRYFESIYFANIVFYENDANQTTYFEKNNPLAIPINSWSDLTDTFISEAIDSYENRYSDFITFYKEELSNSSIVKKIIKEVNNAINFSR